jgi:hypothetical protein
MDSGEPNSIGSSPGRYEAPIEFGSPESAYWTNGCQWFLLVTTNKTQNCDLEIVSKFGRVKFLTAKTGRRQKKQRNHYVLCSCRTYGRFLGLQFWGVVASWYAPRQNSSFQLTKRASHLTTLNSKQPLDFQKDKTNNKKARGPTLDMMA